MKTFLHWAVVTPIILLIFVFKGIVKYIFPITVTITHLWTAYIGFSEGGFVGGILTFITPVLSEFYWVYQMWGVNEFYAWFVLAHIILGFPAMLLTDRE